jgi:hypothetical protein
MGLSENSGNLSGVTGGRISKFPEQYDEDAMRLPIDRQSTPLPKRFPVGARYVVEGRGDEDGRLRVFSRYVVLPGGLRINVPYDLSKIAAPSLHALRGKRRGTRARRPGVTAKKIMRDAGTTRQHRH